MVEGFISSSFHGCDRGATPPWDAILKEAVTTRVFIATREVGLFGVLPGSCNLLYVVLWGATSSEPPARVPGHKRAARHVR